jgi:predicted porin
MKKLVLASAVALALPVMAHADVTISGIVAMGYQHYNDGNLGQSRIDDFGSHLRFNGSDDLGNGMKTIWTTEARFDADGGDTSADTFASRQTYIGLQTAMGTVKMGRIWDVMVRTEETDQFAGPRSDAADITCPVYEDGFLPVFNLGHGTDAGSGAKNSISYDMPTWNGVDFGVQYSAGEDKTTSQGASDHWGTRLEYMNDATKLFIGGAYAQGRNEDVKGDNGYMARIETGYRGDLLSVGLVYNHESLYADTTASGNTNWSSFGISSTSSHLTDNAYGLRVAYVIGSFTPSLEYSHIGDATIDGHSVKTATNLWGVALDYSISKRTSAEVAYMRANEGADLKTANSISNNPSTVYVQMTTKF